MRWAANGRKDFGSPLRRTEYADPRSDRRLEAEAARRGFREVRLIHGKGKGVRRAEVRRLLAGDARVADAFDAPPERGGFGATVVVLKPPR